MEISIVFGRIGAKEAGGNSADIYGRRLGMSDSDGNNFSWHPSQDDLMTKSISITINA